MSIENQLANKILDFKIKMDNPSAWDKFSQEGSDMLRELVDIVEGKQKAKEEKIYKENEEPSLNDLFKGEVIESVEGDNVNVCVKTNSGKEFNIYSEGECSISCVTEVEVWKPKTTILSL